MASCNNPEHAALESELNDALEEALQMEERLAAYEAAGMDDGGLVGGSGAAARLSRATEELTALQEQAATMEKERDSFEQDYLNQKDRVNELETQLEDKDQKTKEMVSCCPRYPCSSKSASRPICRGGSEEITFNVGMWVGTRVVRSVSSVLFARGIVGVVMSWAPFGSVRIIPYFM